MYSLTAFPPIVAFIGRMGSGKSTAATALQSFLRNRFYRVSFAEPLKEMLDALGVPDDNLYVGTEKETPLNFLCGKSARYAMQTLGTEWGRKLIGEDIWVNALMQRIDADQHLRHIIDDARFDNEVAAIRKRGGIIIRIVRGETTEVTHASEDNDHLVADYTINNNGTPMQLCENVIGCLNKWRETYEATIRADTADGSSRTTT